MPLINWFYFLFCTLSLFIQLNIIIIIIVISNTLKKHFWIMKNPMYSVQKTVYKLYYNIPKLSNAIFNFNDILSVHNNGLIWILLKHLMHTHWIK